MKTSINILIAIGVALTPSMAVRAETLKDIIVVDNNANDGGNKGGNGDGKSGDDGKPGVVGTTPAGTNVPEPGTSLLMGGGLLGISYVIRRSRKG